MKRPGVDWNGASAFTSTSGPGVSLMTEPIGVTYCAEITCTLTNVKRGGPSAGVSKRTQLADLLPSVHASHGGSMLTLPPPGEPYERFEHVAAALDLA